MVLKILQKISMILLLMFAATTHAEPFICEGERYFTLDSPEQLPNEINDLIDQCSKHRAKKARESNESFNGFCFMPPVVFRGAALSHQHAYVFISEGDFISRNETLVFNKNESVWHQVNNKQEAKSQTDKLARECGKSPYLSRLMKNYF